MKPQEALERFKAEAEAEGLTLAHLTPWTSWKLFKRFVLHELEGVYESASFQFARFDDDPEDPYLAVFLVWQFTARNWGEPGGGEDRLVGRLVVELRYAAEPRLLLPEAEVWSMDFPTPAEWAAVTEGLPQFQESMSHDPVGTRVFYDVDEDPEAGTG